MAGSIPSPRTRLFYDPGCGPCTFFARVNEWLGRARLEALPYDGKEAASVLGDLEDEARFAYAHLVDAGGRRSGAAIMTPLVGLSLGPTAERVVVRVAPLEHGLRWIYNRFWDYRRTRGCAAPAAVPSS